MIKTMLARQEGRKREMAGNPFLDEIHALVVTGDVRFAGLLIRILRAFGFNNVQVVSGAEEALSHMRSHHTDFMICDWELDGGINGVQFIRRLRTDNDSPSLMMPVIMISGRAEREDIEYVRDSGINEILIKPFSVKLLRERIVAIVEGPREHVFSRIYVGPSRRRKRLPPPDGVERRTES